MDVRLWTQISVTQTYFVLSLSLQQQLVWPFNILAAKTSEMNHKAFTELLCITAPNPPSPPRWGNNV